MKKLVIAGATALVLASVVFSAAMTNQPAEMAAQSDKANSQDIYAALQDAAVIPFVSGPAITSGSGIEEANSSQAALFLPATTPTPTPAPTPKATPAPTPKATPKPTPKATPAPTPKPAARTSTKTTTAASTTTVSSKALAVINTAKSYIGVPYVWGGTTPSGFDCSGYIQYVFAKNGISLPRVASDQYMKGTSVTKSNLKPGDLVFFETYKPGASHVGIYLGNDQFIHESSGAGQVTISRLSSTYYVQHYLGARRVIN